MWTSPNSIRGLGSQCPVPHVLVLVTPASLERGGLSHRTKGPQHNAGLGLWDGGTRPGAGGMGQTDIALLGRASVFRDPSSRSGGSEAAGQAEDWEGTDASGGVP